MRPTMSRGAANAALLRAGWVGDTSAFTREFRGLLAGRLAIAA
jgi:hypothetical protein